MRGIRARLARLQRATAAPEVVPELGVFNADEFPSEADLDAAIAEWRAQSPLSRQLPVIVIIEIDPATDTPPASSVA